MLATKDIAYMFGDTWYDLEVTNLLMSIDLWPTPIMTILLLYALQPKWLNLTRVSLMVIPFFLFTLLNIIFKGEPHLFLINQIYGFLFATIFGIIIFILTFKCDIYINANYSYKRQIDIRWVRYITALMYFISTLWFIFSIESTWLGDTVYYLFTTILTALLFYFVLNNKEVIFPDYMTLTEIFNGTTEETIDHKSPATLRQFAEIEEKLQVAIYQDKIYLNPNLSLTDLAKCIGTNRTYLSRYINNYRDTPFINYINDFRCEEAKRILDSSDSKPSMIELTDKCGFASYSTFRRVFKQKYGCAPSSYHS